MYYNNDKPINDMNQDLLGRKTFAKQLGKFIYELENGTSLVIGIFGKWGAGKTSILNLVEKEINEFSENGQSKPLFIRFSPWHYTDKNNLISTFFKFLKNKIELFYKKEETKKLKNNLISRFFKFFKSKVELFYRKEKRKKLENKLATVLLKYAEKFELLSAIPHVSGVIPYLQFGAIKAGEKFLETPDLESTKEKVEEGLKEFNEKIVVVIDDIDRLTNHQIRDIFQLVKQVGDFSNIIYVLVMDKDVVCRALKEVHDVRGEEYLEKIIQIPINIPEINKSKLESFLIEELKKNNFSKIEIDNYYWPDIFRKCIKPYIKNLRDVKRIMNIFNFKYKLLEKEVSFEDMLAITTVEVLEPKLYKWIYDNKEEILEEVFYNKELNKLIYKKNEGIDYYKYYKEKFEKMDIDSNSAINFLSELFPEFNKRINGYNNFDYFGKDIKERKRIKNKEKFQLYFKFNLDEIPVSADLIEKSAFNFNKTELMETVNKIKEDGNIEYYINELIEIIDIITYERLTLIADVVFGILRGLKKEYKENKFEVKEWYSVYSLLMKIVKKLKTAEERYELINSLLQKTELNELGVMARIIFMSKNLNTENYKYNEDFLKDENWSELKNTYFEKVKKIPNFETLFVIDGFLNILTFFEKVEEQYFKEYMKKLLEEDKNKFKLICSIATTGYRNNRKVFGFSNNPWPEYINHDEIYETIKKYDKKELKQFTETQQIKLATFVLNYRENFQHEHDEEDAKELLNEWYSKK